ncbi:uncharacterized protein MCYG_02704 [Microsporum canis CBS 113480]|uniref:Uncharacterized protein n=1 Tax=Arthroderma otae (strain ATCC MYA-4605 / CBS 113480) TaxID=554155 RepID=C5FGK0_ARTOC|nr:uncharacterized protein MCYG_02704 [Microsporum canis CBS 113480]EEQ29885.1 predicted protein [Microsporum canis CBS 113480]
MPSSIRIALERRNVATEHRPELQAKFMGLFDLLVKQKPTRSWICRKMVYPGDRQALGARLEASALSPIKICLYPHEAFLALMADGARIIPWALQKEKQYGLARVWQPANIVDELPPCRRTATPPAGRGPTDPDALPFTPALHLRGSPGAPFSPPGYFWHRWPSLVRLV